MYIPGLRLRITADRSGLMRSVSNLFGMIIQIIQNIPQRHPPLEHGVTVLDLLFNVDPDTQRYIWGWRDERVPN